MSRRPVAYITGMAGFAGSWLAEELLSDGFTVIGTALKGEATENLRNVQHEVSLERLDVLKPDQCARQVSRVKPDYIFHLAAVASVGKSFAAERLTLQVNFEGTVNMLEAARGSRRLKRFVFVSSADCYGRFTPKNKTLTEAQPLNPISPYGIGKAAAEQAARYYCRSHGLPVVVARSFNHTGPRQAPDFVVPAFARQVARIEAGKQRPVLR
ncbi:MAG: NAD-dependent epimerase/dehydratase family protein, partial [Candidatus Zixiibacteriota bacterium]